MHENGKVLQQLFASVNAHDHRSIAACYHSDAVFRDIAFDLRGAREIQAMWHMICSGDISATVHMLDADADKGRVQVTDEYTFSETGRKVRNPIESSFRFKDGRIIEHYDECDPRNWADMALGGVNGFLAGRFEFLRRWKAKKKLERFIDQHPEYR
jgi:ketosteroid isomerase-like protein